MPRTRSRAAGGASKSKASAAVAVATESTSASSSSAPVYTLAPELESPPRLFVLPKAAGADARIISLRDPRHPNSGSSSRLARYLVCPDVGFFEFTRICAPRSSPRSWLVEGDDNDRSDHVCNDGDDGGGGVETENRDDDSCDHVKEEHACPRPQKRDAHITKMADLHVASPIDPLFLLLPALAAVATPGGRAAKSSKSARDPPKRMFLSVDDHLDAMCEENKDGMDEDDDDDDHHHYRQTAGSADSRHAPRHLSALLRRWPAVRARLEARMAAVCDAVDAGDGETMYRLSEARLQREIMAKAQRMVGTQPGATLPPSMEDRFVTKPLEAPILGVVVHKPANPAAAAATAAAAADDEDKENALPAENAAPPLESLSSTSSSATATSVPCAPEQEDASPDDPAKKPALEVLDTVHAATCASEEVRRLQRLRVAFDFICSRYVAPGLAEVLKKATTQQQQQEELVTTDGVLAKPIKGSTKTTKTATTPATTTTTTTTTAKNATEKAGQDSGIVVVGFAPLDAYLARLADMRREAAASRAADYSRKRGAADEEQEDSRAEKRRRKEEEDKAKKASMTPGARALSKVNTKGMMKLSAFFKKK